MSVTINLEQTASYLARRFDLDPSYVKEAIVKCNSLPPAKKTARVYFRERPGRTGEGFQYFQMHIELPGREYDLQTPYESRKGDLDDEYATRDHANSSYAEIHKNWQYIDIPFDFKARAKYLDCGEDDIEMRLVFRVTYKWLGGMVSKLLNIEQALDITELSDQFLDEHDDQCSEERHKQGPGAIVTKIHMTTGLDDEFMP
jgi:hypothetical protein